MNNSLFLEAKLWVKTEFLGLKGMMFKKQQFVGDYLLHDQAKNKNGYPKNE